MTFAPDYVDVAERRREFFERYETGSLQGEGEFVRDEQGRIIGFLYRALAYRSPEDERPGVGMAFEQIPGKTPYTRDSEVMNAETSAWGRAILAACGIESKKIASANEVRARQDAGEPRAAAPGVVPAGSDDDAASSSSPASPFKAPDRKPPQDDGKPENVVITFGKHKGQTLSEVPPAYRQWLVSNFDAKTAEQNRILEAAKVLEGVSTLVPDDDIPF